jgi:hypothetical protein
MGAAASRTDEPRSELLWARLQPLAAIFLLAGCPAGPEAIDSGTDAGPDCSARAKIWHRAGTTDGGALHIGGGALELIARGTTIPPLAWIEGHSAPPPPYGLMVVQDRQLSGDFTVSAEFGSFDAGVPANASEVSKGALVIYSDEPTAGFGWTGYEQVDSDGCRGKCFTSYFGNQPVGSDGGLGYIGYDGPIGFDIQPSAWKVSIEKIGSTVSIAMHMSQSGIDSTATQTVSAVAAGKYWVGFFVGSAVVAGGVVEPDWPRTAVLDVVSFQVDGGGGEVLSDDFQCDTLH